MTEPTVVMLLSDKRSGSTLFQREMAKHPLVQTVDYSPHTYLETHHWLKGAVLLGMAPQTFAGGRVYPGYGSVANARTYTVDCLKGNLPDYQVPEADEELIFSGWEALCQRFAKPVFFEKSPQYLANWASLSLILRWREQTHFRVKFIGLTRNPLSVQYSASQLFQTEPEKRQYGWLEIQKNLLAFSAMVPPTDFLAVKYEDLVRAPQETFQHICEFLALPPHTGMGGAAHLESLEKWRQDPDFRLQLDPAIVQLARHFNYSPEELFNPPKPEPSWVEIQKKRWRAWRHRQVSKVYDRVIKPFRLRTNQNNGE